MSIHDDLKARLVAARANEELHKKAYLKKTREVMEVETHFVDAKEATLKAADALYQYEVTKIGETSLADHRNWQVEDFRTRMPACMEKIKNEKPLKLLTLSDLDTKY